MKGISEQRPCWGRRALVLALVGGFVGWIVAYVGLLVFLQGMRGMAAPGFPDESDLMLIALVGGGPCGVALGLVLWSVWFLVGRRAAAPDPGASPRP
jgi:hypothetical protein